LKEQKQIEAKGWTDFLEAPSDPDNRSLRTNKDGGCIFLAEGNTCKIQDVKPSICVLEPFVITDFDYETDTIFVALNPLAQENCPGICAGDICVPESVGKAAQAIVQDVLEIVAEKTGLGVTDKKVACIARELLRS